MSLTLIKPEIGSSAPAPETRKKGPICRQIVETDLTAVAELLTRGFPDRTVEYWRRGLEILRARPALPDRARYGFMLEDGGRPVGVLLTLFSPAHPAPRAVCHLSSWYIEDAYRYHARGLVKAVTRDTLVSYVNISPAPHTRRMNTLMGFSPFNEDTVLAAPWLASFRPGVRIEPYDGMRHAALFGDASLAALAADHHAMGCIVLTAIETGGARPFVFQHKALPGLRRGAAQVIYTPSMDDLVRLAGPLGRALWRHGVFIWKLDGAAVPRGLVGVRIAGHSSRWSKGDHPPRLNDLSYSELVIFGP